MSSSEDLPPDLQREIRAERKFSLGEAIGREGGSFLKGSQAMVLAPCGHWRPSMGLLTNT